MPDTLNAFVPEYLSLREREGWLYPDDIVRTLPHTGTGIAHASEWKMRARSAARFRNYLAAKGAARLLEVGCGNGWLSHYLSSLPRVHVTGIDINGPELEQAQRVFKKENLCFLETELRALYAEPFDVILFAASFQYFANIPAILQEAFKRLRPGGSVHIIDTRFYKNKNRTAASQRSAFYFEQQQAPAMRRYYFHHCLSDLEPYKYKVRNAAAWRLRRLTGTHFPWVQLNSRA
jgi:ubiquinone/menaquinone biosynthesis C-methylase UbiE